MERLVAGVAVLCLAAPASASDHLDTPTVTADPSADIGDVFAWTSADGARLNLAMTVVGKRFSDRLQYVFHVDSGAQLGATTASMTILCRFDAAGLVECWAGDADYVHGDASAPSGIEGVQHKLRVFAGPRDDPFFNNVKGTRAALDVAAAALRNAPRAGCPAFDTATSQEILDQWSHTAGGPAKNFLAGWTSSALVLSIDLGVVKRGGPLLAVWAGTYAP
jgi:hypothetical protein